MVHGVCVTTVIVDVGLNLDQVALDVRDLGSGLCRRFDVGLVLSVYGVHCRFGILGLIVRLGGHVGVELVGDRSQSIKVA